MKNWTTKQRYAEYNTYTSTQKKELEVAQKKSIWHLGYHIQPKSGLLNDPNGFSYFNNQWQLFYQNFPYGAVHGLKSWHHLSSKNLIDWQDQGPSLQPHAPYSTHGVYSGSALPIKDRLFLMYTGNVRADNNLRISRQLGAWMTPNNKITELKEPLIEQPEGYTSHFRDPQILAINNQYYALIGAQRQDKTGHILIYQAEQPEGPWTLRGPLDLGYDYLGYMIECPNLAFVDDKIVLIFCPQGMSKNHLQYDNIFPNVYIIADDIDWAQLKLINPRKPVNLDSGFDIYATQIVNGPNHESYSVGWLGLPDTVYPTDIEDWQGCFSLIKKLKLINNKLYQEPVSLPIIERQFDPLYDKISLQEVIHFKMDHTQNWQLTIGNDEEFLVFSFDLSSDYLTVDRTNSGVPFSQQYGGKRSVKLSCEQHSMDLYLDHSSFELFIDDGQETISGRFFPLNQTNWKLQVKQGKILEMTGNRLRKSHQ